MMPFYKTYCVVLLHDGFSFGINVFLKRLQVMESTNMTLEQVLAILVLQLKM